MFDVPDAKRVRRSDLTTRSQSASPTPSSPDPNLEKTFQAQLAALYGPISTTSGPTGKPDIEEVEEDKDSKEQEFEFRLFFSAPTAATTADTTVQKILLEDEESEEEDGSREGRFLRPRPRSYYFARPASEERKQEYRFAALDGEEVLGLASKRAWGLEVPWRVKVLTAPILKNIKSKTDTFNDAGTRIEAIDEETAEVGKKKKPGKKRRIILREKKRKKEAGEEAKRKKEEEKEAAAREKRTKRNREKKVKRKLKEKAKKAGTTNGIEGAEIEGANGQDVGMSGSEDN
ncbi:hypothetical protein BDZ45DRAFT_804746 [Acephala macrosclerotiorum]|nr:hypothetical protein BDZ45DRAFT_804746 [Acephala macrosclerotiorum]